MSGIGSALSQAFSGFGSGISGTQDPKKDNAAKTGGQLGSGIKKLMTPVGGAPLQGAATPAPAQMNIAPDNAAPMGGGGSFSDAEVGTSDFQEPGGDAHWTLREEDNFILAKNQRTGQMMKLQTSPLSPNEKKEVMAPHGAGPINSPNRQAQQMSDGEINGNGQNYGPPADIYMKQMNDIIKGDTSASNAMQNQFATSYGDGDLETPEQHSYWNDPLIENGQVLHKETNPGYGDILTRGNSGVDTATQRRQNKTDIVLANTPHLQPTAAPPLPDHSNDTMTHLVQMNGHAVPEKNKYQDGDLGSSGNVAASPAFNEGSLGEIKNPMAPVLDQIEAAKQKYQQDQTAQHIALKQATADEQQSPSLLHKGRQEAVALVDKMSGPNGTYINDNKGGTYYIAKDAGPHSRALEVLTSFTGEPAKDMNHYHHDMDLSSPSSIIRSLQGSREMSLGEKILKSLDTKFKKGR